MTTEDHRFPCETCGSDLRFDPGDDQLTCDHCGHTEPLEHGVWTRANAMAELDFAKAMRAGLGHEDMVEAAVSDCPNCGAKVEFDPAVHAADCPYCATPVVSDVGAMRQIKPRAVLPFSLEEKEARAEMANWLGSLWFAPGGLLEYARKGRKLNGVYMPAWTFDADTKSQYQGQRGTVYYENKTVRREGKSQTVRVQKIRWRRVQGRVARFFDDVMVLASTALPEKFSKVLINWDLTRLEPYQPEYLAGFRAEAYTIELEPAFDAAREIMDRQIHRDVKFDIGGDRQRVDDIQTQINDVTFKHILVPVWLAAYKYRGKSYRFVVNGQSGQVVGERPWSTWKIAFALIAVALIAAAVGYGYALGQ